MSAKLSSKCKICRREGVKLFLKGERCYSAKCTLAKRKYPPGIHGKKGYPKPTEYGRQLREKQKLKRIYGILERQLKIYYQKAITSTGNAEENLLEFLEKRLDNVIYRIGLATSRIEARQFVGHGHIRVNGRRVDRPSFQVKKNDEITFKPGSKILKRVKDNLASNKQQIKTPGWLSFDEEKMLAKVLSKPATDDLPKDINCKLIIEFYSR